MELKLLLLLAAMAANGHPREQLSPQGLRLCSQVTPGDLTTNLYNFREEFSDVVLVYDDNDELSRDLACLVNQLVPQARSSNLQPEHCMRLLTDPIELAGVFVLITHMPHKVPLCEAPVYGSLPSVIEVRITDTPKTYQNRFLTFNLIGNGGDLRFDVALGNSSETVKNLLLVYKTLFSIVITGRPWSNGTSRRIEFDTIDIPLDTLSPPPEPPEPPPPPSSQMESTAMTTKATQEKASTSSEPVKTPSMELGTVNTLESKALEPVTFPRHMTRHYFHLLLSTVLLYLASGQDPNATAECQSALEACENDLECSNRLAPLMAACSFFPLYVYFESEYCSTHFKGFLEIPIIFWKFLALR
ncbi:unnamed protein product [Heligmosomoides polygyrus]|uniref:Secreted protein n=1 Tax=Heligmosomoides polygyrus TaxID=6339 RepID=A0A183G2V2_HELPZ|nr:unnamed protein product [Heligmosomoides polygyrus]